MANNKYREYFDIDEEYFPQVNESAIAAAGPDFWTRTYPHSTFIEMLKNIERVMARQEKRSLWIEGAYGTGPARSRGSGVVPPPLFILEVEREKKRSDRIP